MDFIETYEIIGLSEHQRSAAEILEIGSRDSKKAWALCKCGKGYELRPGHHTYKIEQCPSCDSHLLTWSADYYKEYSIALETLVMYSGLFYYFMLSNGVNVMFKAHGRKPNNKIIM